MAHTIATQVLLDNTRKTIIKFTAQCDGVTGELNGQIIYDASAYVSPTTHTGIEYIEYACVGCSAKILWDATTDVFVLGLVSDHQAFIKMNDGNHELYNLPNDSAVGKTGDILISTNGFTANTDHITIIMSVIKKSV